MTLELVLLLFAIRPGSSVGKRAGPNSIAVTFWTKLATVAGLENICFQKHI